MTQRILVVDDEPSIRESLQRQLGALGYAVAAADGAANALRLFRDVDPAIVLTDLRMPDMDGLELLERLRERAPDSSVIVMTAHQDMQTALRAMKGGAYDYLIKPLDLDQVELVLARCLRDRSMRRRAAQLAEDATDRYDLNLLVGRDPRMIDISKMIASVASAHTPVLIRGETGTGKEVIARAIHEHSSNTDAPFVAVNCTAIPESLLESELFGHLRGSFTGATSDRRGRFELAGTGTIFLDEVGDVTPSFQAKLLRVLQSGEFYPVGAEQPRHTTARVIAATHRPLEHLVRQGAFREDLYFRLRVVEIVVPPLRERRGDIRLLCEALLARAARAMHKPVPLIPATVMRALENYDWPGNVRELENVLTRALVVARGTALAPEDLALDAGRRLDAAGPAREEDPSLAAVVREYALHVLAANDGNKTHASKVLRISRQRLDRILARADDESVTERGDRRDET